MKHIIESDWSLSHLDPTKVYAISMKPHIFNYIMINKIKPDEIKFNEICYRVITHPEQIRSPRYERADTTYPGIVVIHMENPLNRKYRMIDGAHRMHKNIQAGEDKGPFYVLEYDFIIKYIRPYPDFDYL